MSNPIAVPPSVDAPAVSDSSTPVVAAKLSIASILAAAMIGFCAWAVVFSLRANQMLEYVSAKHLDLAAHPILSPAPGSGEWHAAMEAVQNSDSLVTSLFTSSTLAILTAVGSLVFLWGVGGVRPRHAVAWIGATVLLLVLYCLAGYLTQWLFIISKRWLVPGMAEPKSVSLDTRFAVAEVVQWLGLGIAVAMFASLAFGRPAPIWKAWPGVVVMSALGGVLATCVAMAATAHVEALSPLSKAPEVGLMLGLANAFLCATLAWKATSEAH